MQRFIECELCVVSSFTFLSFLDIFVFILSSQLLMRLGTTEWDLGRQGAC